MDGELNRLEIEDVLCSLPEKEQLLLKMRLADMSYKEIAAALNVSVGSVGTMLARAMQRFKQAYTGKEMDANDELPRSRQTTIISGKRTKS